MKEKVDFLANYEANTEAWIMENDHEWRDAIRKAVDPTQKVAGALSFNFSAFKVNPNLQVENGLEEEVGGLHAQLCKEVRSMAAIALKTSYVGKQSVGKKAIRPLTSIRMKLSALSFLDQSIADLATDTSECEQNALFAIRINSSNSIGGKQLNEVIGMLTRLSSAGLATVYEENADLLEEAAEEPEEESKTEEQDDQIITPKTEWDF